MFLGATYLRCLFVFPNAPLAADFSGGASRYLSSYLALTQLADEVHVFRLLKDDCRNKVLRYEDQCKAEQHRLRAQAASWRDVNYSRMVGFRGRTDLLWRASRRPLEVSSPEVYALHKPLSEIVAQVRPDFVWAEWILSGALATASDLRMPWVYAHHDWSHRISILRREASREPASIGGQVFEWSLRRSEVQILRHSTAVVTGSHTEAQEICALGGRHVEVIPTTYDSVALSSLEQRPAQPARVVHLGSLSTTANYLGLKAYLEKVHPRFSTRHRSSFDFWVVGDNSSGKPELLRQLRAAGANLTGHVSPLDEVLRPFDIAIIPYEQNTGTRTKLPLLFNYAQVVVATRAAVAGSSELLDGENCIVLPSLADFADEIVSLASDPKRRQRIGLAAKETFEKHFTLQAQMPAFQRVVACVTNNYLCSAREPTSLVR